MRALGIAVVTRTGEEASRLRALGRGLVAWSPFIAILLFVFRNSVRSVQFSVPPAGLAVALAVLFLSGVGGALWAALHPRRGLQDRIAGTWLVPR